MNAGVDMDDLIQEGWVGLMMGVRRWDPSRRISIGAFCNKYIFGRIYRSLIGTKNLVHNRRMVTMDDDCPTPTVDDDGTGLVGLLDAMGGDPVARAVLTELLEGHRKGEIMRRHRLTQEAWRAIVDGWMEKMAESVT